MNVYTIISMTYIQLIQPLSKQSGVAELLLTFTQDTPMNNTVGLHKTYNSVISRFNSTTFFVIQHKSESFFLAL